MAGDFDLVGQLSVDDLGGAVVDNFKNSVEGMGGAIAAVGGPLIAMAAAVLAVVGSFSEMIGAASTAEDNLTRLDTVLGNIGATTEIVSGANEAAVTKMGEVTDTYNTKLSDIAASTAEKMSAMTMQIEQSNTDFMAKMADKAAAFNDQLNNMEAAHTDRIASLNEAMDSVRADFADAQEQRQANLADTLAGIEQKSNDKRTSILEKMANTHSSKEYEKLQEELEALDKGTKAQEDAAKAREVKAEAAAKKQEEKRIQAIEKQIEKENKAYEKTTEAAQKRYDKEVKMADEAHDKQLKSYESMQDKIETAQTTAIAKATAAYDKQVDALKAKWGDVALGITPAVTQTVEHMSRVSLLELADSMSKVTVYSKQQVTAAEVLAARYDNIGKDVMPKLITAGADLAALTGGDLSSSVETLGRVLEDPIANIGLLRRAHISLTTEEKAQIKEMMAHNDIAGAQAIVLGKVEKAVGGMAEKMGGTYSGQMAIMGHQIEELAQHMGEALLPTLKLVMEWLIKTFEDPATQKNLQDLGNNIQIVGTWLQKAFVEYGPKIQAFISQLTGWLGSAQQGFASTSGTAQGLATRFGDLTRSIQEGLARLAPVVQFWLNEIQTFWKNNGDMIMLYVTTLWDFISGIFQTALDLIGGGLNMALDIMTGNWSQLGIDFKNTSDNFWKDVEGLWNLGIGKLVTAIETWIAGLGTQFVNLKDDALTWGGNVIDGLKQGILDKAGELSTMIDNFIKDNITGRFNLNFKFGSESKLAIGWGRDIAAGLAQGMAAGTPGVQGAAGAMMAGVSSATNYNTNNSLSMTINQQGGGDAALPMNYLLIRSLADV